MEIKGKVAVVLGAVKGIGKALGLAMAEQGAHVVLTRFDWADAHGEMEADFQAHGDRVHILTLDLRRTASANALASYIKEEFGQVDILINNIERGGWPTVHGAYVEAQWDLEIETTLRAKRWIFDALFPLLKAAPEACVINLSSIAALTGRSGPAALVFNEGYAAANRGVSILTETWARMGAPSIRVNELMLGIFETRHAQGTRGWREVLTDAEKQSLIDHTLAGRTGQLADVVNACNFLIKDAPYMTGSVIRLDGGFVLAGERVPPLPRGIV